MPYSWGGGETEWTHLGTAGVPGASTTGFDCSGLVQYAYWPYVHLPRTTEAQVDVGQTVPRSKIQAGDLIFRTSARTVFPGPDTCSWRSRPRRWSRRPYTGADVRVSNIPTGQIVVKQLD